MAHRTELLIIDAQNDFCDLPASHCPVDPVSGQPLAPALPVAGAHADMQRLAGFIHQAGPFIDAITLTLDSHHRLDIAHPPFWRNAAGAMVAPFTPITASDVRAGRFHTADPGAATRALAYLDALESRGRYTLMVWPVHCQIGSWGHALHADVLAACNQWEDTHLRPVHAVHKGSNVWTEHYSALEAEVPDAHDAGTALNRALLRRLDAAQTLWIAGQASSHCVKATVEHLVQHLPSGRPERLILLTDTMSPVSGFEAQAAAFIQAMQALGVRAMSSAQAAAQAAG
jgi:nicotinamidase-related amidase